MSRCKPVVLRLGHRFETVRPGAARCGAARCGAATVRPVPVRTRIAPVAFWPAGAVLRSTLPGPSACDADVIPLHHVPLAMLAAVPVI